MSDLHEEDVIGKAFDSRLMGRLLVYLRPHAGKVVLSILVLVVISVLELAGPTLTDFTVSHILEPRGTTEPVRDVFAQAIFFAGEKLGIPLTGWAGLNSVGALYFVIIALSFVFLYFQTMLMQEVGQAIMAEMRRQIFGHLQRIQIGFYDRNPVGRLMTRLTTDVDALNELFSAGIVAIFGDVFTLIAIVIWMLYKNWRLALIAFIVLPAFTAITLWFRARARDTYRDVRVRIARINAFLQEHFSGMSIVQIFNREPVEMARFEKINDEHRAANLRSIFYYAVFFPAIDIVSAAGLGLILWYGGGQVVRNTFTLGALIAFLQLAQRFYNPIRDISEKYNILQSAMASSERIFKLLDTPASTRAPATPRKIDRARGEIEFRHVWFAYRTDKSALRPLQGNGAESNGAQTNGLEPEDASEMKNAALSGDGIPWVLKDVSFKIRPGESVALVGHTGAGKTTIASLMLRFYEIQKGQILLDGVDIRERDLADLRRQFSIVLQDVFLFSGTAEANIRLGAQISCDTVRQAAREVHADPFISALPQGYQTEILERGAGLSVGQKQLLSFARALAFDPRILILDEATSSIDTETELLIRDAVTRLMENRTSIIVAHRLSTIQRVDRIIVLHKGEVREIGSHQELLAKRGIYYTLYQLQYKDQELAIAGD